MRALLLAALLVPTLAGAVDYRVRWVPVEGAATYALYDADTSQLAGTMPDCGPCEADVPPPCCKAIVSGGTLARAFATAINASGESAPSNVVQVAQVTPTTSTTLPPPIPPGLLAAYAFEEPEGPALCDASGNGLIGDIGGAQRTLNGQQGLAIVTTNGIATAPPVGQVRTVMAWIMPAVVDGWRCAVSNHPGIGRQPHWFLCARGDRLAGGLRTSSGWAYAAGGKVTVGAWTHAAVTFSGSRIRLYADGVEVNSIAAGLPGGLENGIRIGQTVPSERFAGVVDELRIFGHTLTQAEIQAEMGAALCCCDGSSTTLPPVPTTTLPPTTTSSSSSTTTSTSTTTTATRLCPWPAGLQCPAF